MLDLIDVQAADSLARAREVVRLTAALPEEAWREEAISVVDRLVAAGEILAEQRHIDEGLAAGKLAAARGALALIADDNVLPQAPVFPDLKVVQFPPHDRLPICVPFEAAARFCADSRTRRHHDVSRGASRLAPHWPRRHATRTNASCDRRL